MVKKKITIKEVAKLSGVSITTVSLILNGNTEKFSPKTVQKVLAAKEELGYQPDYFARQMITKETKTIGVLVPDITNPVPSRAHTSRCGWIHYCDFCCLYECNQRKFEKTRPALHCFGSKKI